MDEPINTLTGTLEHFNGLDWVIVAAVSVSLLVGIMRGFAREALSLLGWISAFVGANVLAKPLAESLITISDSPTLRYLVGWGLVFIGVLAIFSVVGSLLAKQLRQPGFNLGNRLLGGVFGLFRGLVIMMVVTLMLKGMLPDTEEDWLNDAKLMPMLDEMADWFSENFDDLLEAKPVETIGESLESQEML
jgi:membrane protein required for colicin V production